MRTFLALLVCSGTLALPALARAEPEPGGPIPQIVESDDALLRGFLDPPMESRPRTWWHWMNGNVTTAGIHKDLEWMKRIGLGGVQAFDIDYFATPVIVDKRLAYMSPEWKDAFRYAAGDADRLGLELTIASSPGWSVTGGPWVAPRDGMKKLVWSETTLSGRRRFRGKIALPPSFTGPFQDIVLHEPSASTAQRLHPQFYADVATLAVREREDPPLPLPVITEANGKTLDAGLLTDGKFEQALDITRDPQAGAAMVVITYPVPVTIRSATVFVPGGADMFSGPTMKVSLEVGHGGADWRHIAEIVPSLAPSTVSFDAVTAERFRLTIRPAGPLNPYDADAAPGYLGYRPTSAGAASAVKLAELHLSPQERVNQFEIKAGFGMARDYHALGTSGGSGTQDTSGSQVIDLTSRLKADGTLDWTPPAGTWKVLRMGYSLTGRTNGPASVEATGLEVDKLDAEAVSRYLNTYLDTYSSAVGGELMGNRGVRALLTDSTEVGAFNYTPGLFDAFRKARGYDPRAWLPALTGVVVGSRAGSEAFLSDWRKTIAELHASNHYGTIARVAHDRGLKVYGESLEGWRVSLGDDIAMRQYADVPMAAMWTYRRDLGPRPNLLADLRGAASTAHIYGRRFAAAESFTSTRYPWAHAPSDLRRVIDLEFASGINLPVIHTSVHQPLDDRQPGLSMRHIGQFFTRHETWAEMARPWIDYIARSSFLLQQGRYAADVAYFYGEEAPVGPQAQDGYFTDTPAHFGYDFVNADAVLSLLKVEDGSLVAPGGMRYRVLYLGGNSSRMTLPMLRRIARLAEDGAAVVGLPPEASPGLGEDPQEFAALVAKLWPGSLVTEVGKGKIVASRDVEEALASLDVLPDFEGASGDDLLFLHRILADGDAYFVSNRKAAAMRTEAAFRVVGKIPEIWRADTGTVSAASYRIDGGRTFVTLPFESEESYFVVFRKPSAGQRRAEPGTRFDALRDLSNDWSVTFQQGRGAPAAITMPQLRPLNEVADAGVRYFSGIATYSRSFKLDTRIAKSGALWLDLGAVGDLAEVRVNGKSVGTLWHAPYRIDIGRQVRSGRNTVEVRVANLWMNRLIGDAQKGVGKIAYTIMPTYKAEAPLRPSGLIGPVRLMEQVTVTGGEAGNP